MYSWSLPRLAGGKPPPVSPQGCKKMESNVFHTMWMNKGVNAAQRSCYKYLRWQKRLIFFNINILLQRGPCQLAGLAACMSKCHPDLSCCLLRADARSLNQSQASHKRCGVDNVYTLERPAGCLWYERGKIVKKKNVLSVKTSAQTQHGDKAQTRFQSRNFGFCKWRRWTLHKIVHSLIFFLGVPYLWEVI